MFLTDFIHRLRCNLDATDLHLDATLMLWHRGWFQLSTGLYCRMGLWAYSEYLNLFLAQCYQSTFPLKFYWNYISLSFPVLWKDHKGHIKNVATDNTYGDWSTTIIDSEIISLERPRHHPFHGHSRSFQNRAWKLFKVFSYKINVWHTRLG